jgi:hypothetical protein
MDDEAVERGLREITHDDRGTTRLLRDSLRRLADQDGATELRDLARDVLAGRTTLRQAALSEAYGPALFRRGGEYARRFRELDADERERLAEEGARRLRELADGER